MSDTKKKVLFLCIGNTCRSQMAEGYLNSMAGERFEAFSAGLKPAREVHPMAVEVMKSDGIDISDKKPEGVDKFLGRVSFSVIIVVCKQAHELCPVMWPGMPQQRLLYWPVEDPVSKENASIDDFAATRDKIKEKLNNWLTSNQI